MMSGSDYFDKYDIKAEELYDLEKFSEAIEFLEPAFDEFPEQYFFIAWRVLVCYRKMGQFDKCLQIVDSGVKRGYFFNLQWKSWDLIRKVDGAEPILAENERLSVEDLPAPIRGAVEGAGAPVRLPAEGLSWDAMEEGLLQQALERSAGNRAAAARLLGLSYKAFLYRLEKYDLIDGAHGD